RGAYLTIRAGQLDHGEVDAHADVPIAGHELDRKQTLLARDIAEPVTACRFGLVAAPPAADWQSHAADSGTKRQTLPGHGPPRRPRHPASGRDRRAAARRRVERHERHRGGFYRRTSRNI